MPTAPDLLCLFRTPPAGGRVDVPRVVLAGDAESFPLSAAYKSVDVAKIQSAL